MMLWNHWFSTSFSFCTKSLPDAPPVKSAVLPGIYWAHCLWKLWFDILKPHLQTSMSFSSFLAIFPLRPEYAQRAFFWLKNQKKRKLSSLDQQSLLRNLSIQLAWSISHYRLNHFLLKNDKFFNSANPLDKFTQEYQYTKIYEKQEDHFRIICFQPSQCQPAFFSTMKSEKMTVESGWWLVVCSEN